MGRGTEWGREEGVSEYVLHKWKCIHTAKDHRRRRQCRRCREGERRMGVVTGRGEGKSGREMEGGLGIYKNERVRKVRKRLSPPALPGDRNTRLPGIAVDCAQIRLRTPDFRCRRTPCTVFKMLSRDLARHYYVITLSHVHS